MTARSKGLVGSSPLTRGKLLQGGCEPGSDRLIPAHAGKTTRTPIISPISRAHPRSRGENTGPPYLGAKFSGSSPLTRGKQRRCLRVSPGERLIPAHAGKTAPYGPAHSRGSAHPRSRGENASSSNGSISGSGSSPLTRGKRIRDHHLQGRSGLIPAHAGKTTNARGDKIAGAAHPRSRGENIDGFVSGIKSAGSSPLTRGKRAHEVSRSSDGRLIPAHAGKTSHPTLSVSVRRAHPRSRGENRRSSYRQRLASGSSPLTRGKPLLEDAANTRERLIPAHAGKTSCRKP